MKAAYITETGLPSVIQFGEIESPTPQDDEIQIRVHASSVNPIDTYIRGGMVQVQLPKQFSPGCDFAGVVEQVGKSVTRFKTGDRVWGTNQGLLGRQGTAAELIAVKEHWAYKMPENGSFAELAAISLVGITAHLGLFRCARLMPGETVFVNGGTGGVGAMVIQMAKAVAAKVITTVGSAEKAKIAKSLGADVVLNYKTDNIPEEIAKATSQKGVNVWFETQPPADFDSTVSAMAANGRIIVMAGRAARPVLPNGPFYVKGLSMHGFAMFNIPHDEQRVCAEEINRWVNEGKLKALIGKTFALNQLAAAHELQEANTLKKAGSLTGKIVITI